MLGHRFQTNPKWQDPTGVNTQWLGLNELILAVCYYFLENKNLTPVSSLRMIEIGSYMGESTKMFATSGLFSDIKCVEPFKGDEEFNTIMGYTWKQVKDEFHTNTKSFDCIQLHQGMSYELVDNFKDNSFDFIYIDADHSYDSVKKDIQLYLPKLKKGGIMAGHDYHDYPIENVNNLPFPGVKKAINEELGKPDRTFWDSSWMHVNCNW